MDNEKSMFKKWKGDDFIMHGLCVDDMAHVLTSQKLKEEIMEFNTKNFNITSGNFMQTHSLGWRLSELTSTSNLLGSKCSRDLQ